MPFDGSTQSKKAKTAKPERVVFVRDVTLATTPEDALVLDGQSKICNRLHNDLRDEVGACMAELALISGYGLTDDPVIKAMAVTERYKRKEKQRGEVSEVEVTLTREQQLLRTVFSENGLRDLVPGLKEQHPFLKAVHSSPLKNVARRLSKALRAWQESKSGKRKGPKVGWPKYKSWKKDWYSLEYEEPGKGWSVENNRLHLTLGVDREGKRLSLSLPLIDPPKELKHAAGVRIVKRAGVYRAVFTVSVPARSSVQSGGLPRLAYIDPGSKILGHLLASDGLSVELSNTPGLADLDRRADKIKSKRDRYQKQSRLVEFTREDGSVHRHWEPSPRWRRLDDALRRAETVRRDRTKHHLFALGHTLFRAYDVVGIGDWAPENADARLGTGRRWKKANRTLRNTRHLGRLREVLAWVAVKSGKRLVVMDESGTTRTCSHCDHVVAGGLHPGIREWDCAVCGTHHLRDENASQNGLRRLAATVASVAGNFQVPRSGPGAPRVAHRCRLAFRPDGRWEVGQIRLGAATNEIAAPETTGAALGPAQGGSGIRRPDLRQPDSLNG
jgi:putative transposase